MRVSVCGCVFVCGCVAAQRVARSNLVHPLGVLRCQFFFCRFFEFVFFDSCFPTFLFRFSFAFSLSCCLFIFSFLSVFQFYLLSLSFVHYYSTVFPLFFFVVLDPVSTQKPTFHNRMSKIKQAVGVFVSRCSASRFPSSPFHVFAFSSQCLNMFSDLVVFFQIFHFLLQFSSFRCSIFQHSTHPSAWTRRPWVGHQQRRDTFSSVRLSRVERLSDRKLFEPQMPP